MGKATRPRGRAGKKTTRKKRTHYAKRRYNDADRFAAIGLAKTIGIRPAADKLGIPFETVEAWAKGFRCPASLQMWTEAAGDLAHVYHCAAWDCLAEVKNKIEDAPLNHLMGAAEKATNLERLLRGEPTSYTKTESIPAQLDLTRLTPEQLHALRSLLALARTVQPVASGTGQVPAADNQPTRTVQPLGVRSGGVADPEPGPDAR